MQFFDYNGTGKWAAAEILARYAKYAAQAGIDPRDLSPYQHTEGCRHWTYPVMDKVIDGIEAGDVACIRIGIEFIEEDQGFAFGRILKANTARALRRSTLTTAQKHRILRRVFRLLQAGRTAREFRQYFKLARQIGFRADQVPNLDEPNPYVDRFHAEFIRAARL